MVTNLLYNYETLFLFMKHLKESLIGKHNIKNAEKDNKLFVLCPHFIGAPDLTSMTKFTIVTMSNQSCYITTRELMRKYKDLYKRYINDFEIIIPPPIWDIKDIIDDIEGRDYAGCSGTVVSFKDVIK